MHLPKRAARATLAVFAAIVVAGISQLTGAPQHQKTTPEYGIRDKSTALTAFTHATIVVSPTVTYEDATLLIRDGKVAAIGKSVTIPADAEIIDLKDKFIYPAFIEPYSEYGLERTPGGRPERGGVPQYEGRRVGVDSWNDAVRPELNLVNEFKPDDEAAGNLIEAGYAIAQSCRMDGVFRGRGFVALLNSGLPNDQILVDRTGHFLSFNKGSSRQEYPSSQMGSIALIRQTLMDADWYAKAQESLRRNPAQAQIETNLSLAALAEIRNDPVVFDPEDEVSLLRADKIAKEFGLKQIYLGNGFEYSIAAAIKATGASLILPVNFPKAPYVKTAEDALDVSLADLRHWEMAPSNLSILEKNQIEFAVTSTKLKDPGQVLVNLRKAIKRGLTKQTALAALTTIPAKLTGVADRAGTLESGKLANFIIAGGEIFDEEFAIQSVWIAGTKHRVEEPPDFDMRGNYKFTMESNNWELKISGKMAKPQGTLIIGAAKKKLDNFNSDGDAIQFSVELDTAGYAGILRFSGLRSNRDFAGNCALPNGRSVSWSAVFASAYDEKADSAKADSTKSNDEGKGRGKGDRWNKEKKDDDSDTILVSKLTYPNKAYGLAKPPVQENVLIRNATVWTSEADGILANTDVLVVNGKFSAVGKNLTAPAGATVIDGTGKHVTAGIIDEHSHIAISRGVNEGSHSITSEVRIGDVLNPEDISIYRTLAGGVTMSQLLHGSANPIGGQAQVIKHRWGGTADDLKYSPAPATIKFALGENVKQSNWGDRNVIRYPQTRMGVETVMKDAFLTAREYENAWKKYNALSSGDKLKTIPPRRDIQLDALADIMNSKMFVHCHSYHQTEVLMLMRLAEELGFHIQTFTHILEGYKVADEMREHGASANTFSDWWAYKFEVYDAIPYNAALMVEKGVLSGVNSDDGEMARRLNQEAGKAVLYGNMSQEEAIRLVTINPAKQLKVDAYVGSIKVGKDGDFVIWNDNPLSTYSKVEQTWIEGRNYFSLAKDSAIRADIIVEKSALTQKVLKSGGGEKDRGDGGGFKRPEQEWHCEDVHDVWREQQ